MKENWKIARQLKNFYIGMVVAALLFVLFNVLYAGYDSGMAFTGVRMERKIENMVTEEAANHTFNLNADGFDLVEQVRMGETFGLGTMNFFLMFFWLVVASGVYYMRYQSGTAKEFLQTTPVKGRKWILQPFFVIGGMVAIIYVMEGVCLLLMQTKYNRLYQQCVENKGLGSMKQSCIAGANAKLCWVLLIQLLVVLALYVWFALWLTASKNKLCGMIALCGMIGVIYWIVNCLYWQMNDLGHVDVVKLDGPMYHIVRVLYSILNPVVLFEETAEEGVPRGICMIVLIMWILLGTLAIVWITQRRELSKGKWFYTMEIDVVVSVFVGLAAFEVMLMGECDISQISSKKIGIGCIIAIVTAVVAFCILHPGMCKEYQKVDRIRITHKRGYQELLHLLQAEWKVNLFFLVANCIWMIVQCQGYSFYMDWSSVYNLLHGYSAEHMNLMVETIYQELDWNAYEVIAWYTQGVIVWQLAWLLGRKFVQSYRERNAAGREFLAALPVRRQTKYWYETIRDCVMLLLPVGITTLMIAHRFQWMLQGPDIYIDWAGRSIYGLAIRSSTYLLMVYGLIRWLETQIPNGVLRMPVAAGILYTVTMVNDALVRCGTVGRAVNDLLTLYAPLGGSVNAQGEYVYDLKKPDISLLSSAVTQYIHSSDYDVTAPVQLSAFYNASDVSSYIGYVLLYVVIAGILLYFAGRLAKKQEYSAEGLYFSFTKYVFATAVSLATGIILMQNAVAWWHRLLIGILVIGIFVILVYYLDPERKLLKRQKVGVEK